MNDFCIGDFRVNNLMLGHPSQVNPPAFRLRGRGVF